MDINEMDIMMGRLNGWMDIGMDAWMDGWITDVVGVCWFEFYPAEATPLVVGAVIDGVVGDGDAALPCRIPTDDGATVGVLDHRHVLRRNRHRTCIRLRQLCSVQRRMDG